MGLMDLDVHFPLQIWEISCHYFFEQRFCPFLFLFMFWDSHNSILVYLMVYQKSHRISSLFSILFFFFLPAGNFKWLLFDLLILSSAWQSLLLKLFMKFFSSIIVFLSSIICLVQFYGFCVCVELILFTHCFLGYYCVSCSSLSFFQMTFLHSLSGRPQSSIYLGSVIGGLFSSFGSVNISV